MISPRTFLERWRYSPLVKATEEAASTLAIPASSKRFLIAAGLPTALFTEYPFPLNFNGIKYGMPRLTDALAQKRTIPDSFSRYRLLGSWRYERTEEDASYVCLDEAGGGSVVDVNFEHMRFTGATVVPEGIAFSHTYETHISFYNSSVRQYAECLLAHEEAKAILEAKWATFNDDDDIPYDDITEGFQETLQFEFHRIDPLAMEIASAVWPYFIDRYFG